VKIDYDLAGIAHHDTSHRAGYDSTAAVHDQNAGECRDECASLSQQGRPAIACPDYTPHDDKEKHSRKYRKVLVQRQQRQRVEERTDRCQHRVRRRVYEQRVGYRDTGFCIQNWRRTHERCPQNEEAGDSQGG